MRFCLRHDRSVLWIPLHPPGSQHLSIWTSFCNQPASFSAHPVYAGALFHRCILNNYRDGLGIDEFLPSLLPFQTAAMENSALQLISFAVYSHTQHVAASAFQPASETTHWRKMALSVWRSEVGGWVSWAPHYRAQFAINRTHRDKATLLLSSESSHIFFFFFAWWGGHGAIKRPPQ